VRESSGLAASRRTPGTYWTHNDSGDEPLVYCIGATAGLCGVWRVTGADAFDWEGMAAGPGPVANTPYLYLGDIGDNLGNRSEVVVYRVPEPAVAAGAPMPTKAAPAATDRADALRLRYPDGPHDAEALLVHPTTGDLYIVAKESGPGVYVARAPLSASSTTTMTKVANLSLTTFASQASHPTGGDISPDGRRVALCNYVEALEYRLPADASSFDALWQQAAVPINFGLRPQGEAVAYRLDGKALLASSEKGPLNLAAPLYQVEQR
ncbi:MAG: PE family protein, partial [Acidimicrobiales bacterium]